MARQTNYGLDTTVTALDRLTGVDSMTNQTVNFTIESVAQLFASTGIADPSKISFFYRVNANGAATTRGDSYFTSNGAPGFAGVSQITINRFDNSGVGVDGQGVDFSPVQRFVVGGEIKLTSVQQANSWGYGLYAINTVTENADNTLTLDVTHTASQGVLPTGAYTISLIGAVSAEARGNSIFDGAFVPTLDMPAGSQVGDLFISLLTVDGHPTASLYVRRQTEWMFVSSLTGAIGPQGPQGIQGPIGEQGIQGDPGLPISDVEGTFDSNGERELNFFIGPDDPLLRTQVGGPITVPSGAQGEQGIQGVQGDQGDQGIQGEQGFSISASATENTGLGENNTITITSTDTTVDPVMVQVNAGNQGIQGEADRYATTLQVNLTPEQISDIEGLSLIHI